MTVDLREVTRENFRKCIRLSVTEEQKEFVASNLFSMAQAKVEPTMSPMAIYHGEQMVGFAMFGIDSDDQKPWIWRLMIDHRYQGQGFGRAAMQEIIRRLRALPEGGEIFLSFEPGNEGARRLYESLGFRPDGRVIDGEIIYRLEA